MRTQDFDFHLPEELIAQRPLPERDRSRLMVLSRSTGAIEHRLFTDIASCLKPGDVLVLNDTKVIRARLEARKSTGGRVEVLLVRMCWSEGVREGWICLIRNSKGLEKGALLHLDGGIEAEVLGRDEEGLWTCSFTKGLSDSIERLGKVPLPPYIRREADSEDVARYQTVFARESGAVAAPTAGLHFTQGLLDEVRNMGVEVRRLTLHTGPGTFMPVRVDDISTHRMLKERYTIGKETFDAVTRAKAEKRRVIAVGTTSARALESAFSGEAPALRGDTALFIYPGFEFRAVDALITNFHLSGSTLIMLASAFAGHKPLMGAYKEAIRQRYRFFSYGDAMFIV